MQALRRKGLAWEKDLDPQREHQLLREGIFWHDPTLDGLSDDDRPDWVVPKRKEGGIWGYLSLAVSWERNPRCVTLYSLSREVSSQTHI